jgi:hypothetical protein
MVTLNASAKLNESSAEGSLAHAVWISSVLGNGRVDLYQAVGPPRNATLTDARCGPSYRDCGGQRYVDKLLTRNNRTLPSPVDDLLLEL